MAQRQRRYSATNKCSKRWRLRKCSKRWRLRKSSTKWRLRFKCSKEIEEVFHEMEIEEVFQEMEIEEVNWSACEKMAGAGSVCKAKWLAVKGLNTLERDIPRTGLDF